jgi:hypothetical protein
MKKLLVTLAAVLVSVSTFAQGTVIFNNRTSAGDARITLGSADGPAAGSVAGMTAQLFLVNGSTLTAVTPTTTFRDTPAAAQYFLQQVIATVPGVAPGGNATLRLRVWQGPSYEAAAGGNMMWFGESNDVLVNTLGGTPAGGGAPFPEPDLSGLQSFFLTQVPEPSTLAFGVLGAAALLYRRRK